MATRSGAESPLPAEVTGAQSPAKRSIAAEVVAAYQAILNNTEPPKVAREKSLFFWRERERAKIQSTLGSSRGGTSVTSNSA